MPQLLLMLPCLGIIGIIIIIANTCTYPLPLRMYNIRTHLT
jgi:hypothetical protein